MVGSIASNQSFINDQAFINSAVASAFRRAHHFSPILSNSLDSTGPITTQRDSPPACQNLRDLRSQLESSGYHSTAQYSPYQVTFKPLNSRKLNRTQSAPLPFGLPLLQRAAAINNNNNNNNQPNQASTTNYSPLVNNNSSGGSGPMDTHQLVMQKMKQQILTKKQQQQQKSIGNLSNKPSSFEEMTSHSAEKKSMMYNEKNLDSGSGSFEENYSETGSNLDKELLLQQRQFLEQIQQQINSSSRNETNMATTEELTSSYRQLLIQRQLMMLLQSSQQQQQQQQSNPFPIDPSVITSIINQQQLQQPTNNSSINYAKLVMNSQYLQQQANGLKRALSQPMMVSPAPSAHQFYSNQLFSPACALLSNQQPSLTSLVAPFSGLNLSHNNINLIPNASSVNSGPASPDHNLINEHSTALVTDGDMLKHDCTCGNPHNHLESSDRLLAIIKRLYETGLTSTCVQLPARKATLEELETCHSSSYCQFFATEPTSRHKKVDELPIKSLIRMNCGGVGIDNDTIWNDAFTWSAVRAAAGCVIDLASLVATKKLKNGFAIVRPPGHHAEYQQPMGKQNVF